MKKYLSIALLMLASIGFAASPDPSAYHGDRFLICLQPELALGKISMKEGAIVTGLASLDQLLVTHKISSMEKYLPAATADDMDGDIILSNIYRLTFVAGESSLTQSVSDFNADHSVLYAELEPAQHLFYSPNDSRYSSQWYIPKIEANAAWDLWNIAGGNFPGNVNIVLASVDTGVQYTHPDLWQRVWINQAEVPADIFSAVDTDSDGVITPDEVVGYVSDYDSNGSTNLQDALHSNSPFMDGIDADDWDSNVSTYVDDLVGWDVAGTTSGDDSDNDPMGTFTGPADSGNKMHGTHVAGLLAAKTNNSTGIASTIFNGSIMSVKVLYDQSDGGISGGTSGMLYAAKAGADILNMSWGGAGYSGSNQAVVNVIHDTYGSVMIAAAGNGNDNGTPSDTPHYPSGYDHVVSVTAVGSGDNFSWANYGNGEGNSQFYGVDISAPGESILSTVYTTNGNYQSWDGTSMASPIVASAFGLLKSLYPEQTSEWLTENILGTTDPIDDLNPNFAGQLGTGRLNIFNAVARQIFPSISFNSYSLYLVNDNGDGLLSPGEGALMRINLFNDPGWVDALDVTAVMHSTSEFVTIVDSSGAYGDINNGNVGVNILDRYEFSIAADAPSGQFPFTLDVTANSGSDNVYTTTLEFTVEVSMWQANFPIASSIIKGGNAVVDLDGDGGQEIIYCSYDSLLHAVQVDGSELAGFPVFLNYLLEATPSVGDIDNDGDLEIVVGGLDRNLYVIQHDGSSEAIYLAPGFILAPSTLYDLDGDGDLEIITPAYNDVLGVMHHDGTPLAGFPLTLDDNMTVGAAVGDINGDGNINIVVGTWGDQLHALNLDGTEVPGFPVTLTDRVRSAPALANIDGSEDGSLEIIFGSDDNRLHAYDATGNELWYVSTSGQNIQADPAVSDLDGDGDYEIVFGGLDRLIYAVDHTGTFLQGWPIGTGGSIYSSPALADINGDGLAEIFIGSNDRKLYGLNLDGSNIGGFPNENTANIQGSPTVADLDGDGDLEVIVGGDDNLLVMDLSSAGDTEHLWSTHRGNLQRTGSVVPIIDGIDPRALPASHKLYENYPNPFNPTTLISFDLAEAGHVSLQILDIRGRVVDELIAEDLHVGSYAVSWRGELQGKPANAGIYFYRLSTQQGSQVRKMTLLK